MNTVFTLSFCVDGDCNHKNDRNALIDEAEAFCKSHNIQAEVKEVACLAACEEGPALFIQPRATWYRCESLSALHSILTNHLINGQTDLHYVFHQGEVYN